MTTHYLPAELSAENRKLKAAQHSAALDIDCAMSCLRNGGIDAALRWMERANDRLYRDAPKREETKAGTPSELLMSQLRASVELLNAEKGGA
jgi:hypothetical protein